MKTPINFQDYLYFRKDQVANDMFKVLYNDLSSMGQEEVNDEVATEFIKIFNLLYIQE
jgi:hypothetical protein